MFPFPFTFRSVLDSAGSGIVSSLGGSFEYDFLDISRLGLLLLDLARPESSSPSISLFVDCWVASFFLADLVIGPKYPSCVSRVSDGVGEGEMTLGVPGIGFKAMVKGGRVETRITPVKTRPMSATLRIQDVEIWREWRWWSFLEARSGVVINRFESRLAHWVTGSSCRREAEQDCTASLKREMMTDLRRDEAHNQERQRRDWVVRLDKICLTNER